MSLSVDVCIVSFESAADLPGCLEAVAALEHRPLGLLVVDCASSDASLEAAHRFEQRNLLPTTVVALDRNQGFAGGMNAALSRSSARAVLLLNPDALPAPDYVGCLCEALAAAQRKGRKAGGATGRLVRPRAGGERRLDACGMRLTPTWRHLDRGSGELDRGQLSSPERVFGVTGAASLLLREALDDAAVEGRVFDEWFHSFREDAELCFRLQERGWDLLYEPRATAEHRRRVLPERRSSLPAHINYHSLKNRYLLRLYHQSLPNLLWTLPFTLYRDLLALGHVALRERSSLGAYAWIWRHRRAIIQRRRRIQAAKRHSIEGWFLRDSLPA